MANHSYVLFTEFFICTRHFINDQSPLILPVSSHVYRASHLLGIWSSHLGPKLVFLWLCHKLHETQAPIASTYLGLDLSSGAGTVEGGETGSRAFVAASKMSTHLCVGPINL